MAAPPVAVAYFYRVRWGFVDEWLELFERKHWPILREQLRVGRFTDVQAYTPRFHGDGRAARNRLATITFRDWASIEEHSDADIAARLYPDQATFRAEEQ